MLYVGLLDYSIIKVLILIKLKILINICYQFEYIIIEYVCFEQEHVNLEHEDGIVVPLIFFNDKNALSKDGKISGHPIYFTIANMACEDRHVH